MAQEVFRRYEKKYMLYLEQIRCRNGNLSLVCGRVASGREEL